jgi:hypothetical protein
MIGTTLPESQTATADHPSRRLRISFRSGSWHMHEEGTDLIGGIFASLSAAVAFGRSELRGRPGATMVVELEGSQRT